MFSKLRTDKEVDNKTKKTSVFIDSVGLLIYRSSQQHRQLWIPIEKGVREHTHTHIEGCRREKRRKDLERKRKEGRLTMIMEEM